LGRRRSTAVVQRFCKPKVGSSILSTGTIYAAPPRIYWHSACMNAGSTWRRVSMPTATGHTTAIRTGKAIGTSVFDGTGKKIGEVKDIVLEKTSNNIMFAVVSFGGVLGMGERYHPVPWSEL